MKTPINNLVEPHFPQSSAQPGVSGESVNAPYGPKAVDECGIDSIINGEYEMFDHSKSGYAVGKTSGPAEPEKEMSSLQPK